MNLTTVARLGDVGENAAILVEVEGEEIGLFRVNGSYYALRDACPHREAYLHEGHIEGDTVTCPWHFAVIDLKTGTPISGPVECPVKTYGVVIDGEEIKIAYTAGEPE